MSLPAVCVLVDRFPVLTETFVAAEVRELERLGHAVRVEAVERGADPPVAAAFRAEDGRGTRLAALLWLAARHPRRCLADLHDRRRWRREERVPPLREIAPVARRISRSGEQHLHAHFATAPALTALRLARLLGLSWSVVGHAWDLFLAPANLAEKLERAAVAFTGCEYNARYLTELAPAARIEVVVMGVDLDAMRRSAPHPEGRTVLAVGRLVEKKGFAVLARAAERLPDARVLVVGDGPLRGALEGTALELLGERDPDEVRRLMEQADVLAMPSVVAADGDRDSMPVVVKEAMAMELPVVASDEVGLPECVRPPWGRLVAPGDASALAGALEEVLALPAAERAVAGAAGREWVLDHADVRRETARVSAAIARVAS